MAAVDAPHQVLGRAISIGCVAVEITQRCNLDCSLCYLSENSEHVVDIPLEEVFRRLDEVLKTYGPYTNVQITGGDPTLRKHHELVQIVRYAANLKLFPALFTNGIAASRELLSRLAAVGLKDVAFHVDTTQGRSGYADETALNELRREYLARAQGLGLMVIFNTTIYTGNITALPDLLKFFIQNANAIGFASFQVQADTGRGSAAPRNNEVSPGRVREMIEHEAGRQLPWDVIRVGHPRCHSYLPTLVIGKSLVPLVEDRQLIGDFIATFSGGHADRREGRWQVALQYFAMMLRRPRWLWRAARFSASHVWRSRHALLAARGRVQQLSFFVHNFMDRDELDSERLNACSFMAMTHQGPVAMCEHNARRDEFILQPIKFRRADGSLGDYKPLKAARR